MGITTSKYSALSVFTPLVFETQLINGALFLKTSFFSPNKLSFAVLVAVTLAAVLFGSSKSAVTVFLLTKIFPFTTIYASLLTL